ncbi:gram-negative porin family protein [Rhodoferax antarcticus ANT.BR]|uniref:Gram-negative porin family protein n=1 Tax=Rhodoferax antarcticus ANT.BR TaxID=1111071 RepID=A0A1Q8YK43_9BURK|nr:gram-negative porin family protein [Rhodoferax antarcticus ANT.BR]
MTQPLFSSRALRATALACALCCAGLAQAQVPAPGVTLYGLADAGITSTSGLKAGRVTQVASGIMEGSRWGIKGNEDLGGGYKAIFTLEARVELDTGGNSSTPISGGQLSDRYSRADLLGLNPNLLGLGTTQPLLDQLVPVLASQKYGVNVGPYGNRFFDRQAFVGLITPVGAVLAGRMYTPAFETNATFDIMATQSGLAAGQIVTFPSILEIRQSNSIAYRLAKDGFSGSVMYSLGDRGEADSSNMIGFNASYKTDSFAVGLGHNATKNELGQNSLKTTVLGASMTTGPHKFTGMAIQITDDNPANMGDIGGAVYLSLLGKSVPAGTALTTANAVKGAYTQALKQDGRLYHIGYRYTTGPHTVSVAYNTFNDKRPYNADVDSYGAAYTYALSKRTDLNAVLVRYDNGDKGQVAPGGNGFIGGVTASAGTDSTAVQLGIRHRF